MTELDLLTRLHLALADLPDEVRQEKVIEISRLIETYNASLRQRLAEVAESQRREAAR